MTYPKRLIEVDLPIKKISAHARREKSIRHGHISTLHIWWARRPLAACRAVICAALWIDPVDENCPQEFREGAAEIITAFAKKAVTDKELSNHCSPEIWQKWQVLAKPENALDTSKPNHLNILRYSLLDFIGDFANWDNSTQPDYLETSRKLTQLAHECLGGIEGTRPLVVDPFAGGGAIPLEALRVGADAFASDLNPVAVLLNKVVLEYIPKYGQELADEVRKWGQWVKEEAEKELAQFYPKDEEGNTPIAYLWARTILSEAPDDGTGIPVEVPLMRSLWLAKKKNKKVALRWVRDEKGQVKTETVDVTYADGVTRTVRRPLLEIFKPKNAEEVEDGTVARGSATCPVTGFTTPVASVRKQLKPRHGGANDARLFCVVYTKESVKGRFYRLPTQTDLEAVRKASEELEKRKREHQGELSLVPDEPTPQGGGSGAGRAFSQRNYGMDKFEDLFTFRQSLALTVLSKLVEDVSKKIANGYQIQIKEDSSLFLVQKLEKDKSNESLADAVQTCLSLAASRQSDYTSSLCSWHTTGEKINHTFGRQAIPIVWDFADVFPLSNSTGNFLGSLDWVRKVCDTNTILVNPGQTEQISATTHLLPNDFAQCFLTDPPYYDSVPYADLSDFFYVWLKRTLPPSIGIPFSDELTPKEDECIVDEVKGKDKAYFETTMAKAMSEGCRILSPDGVGVIVFAHKSTSGWETQLQAMVDAGWTITGSWAIDTEMGTRLRAMNSAALASSVHLVVRPRNSNEIGDWRDVLQELPQRIHAWMPRLASEGVVGADAIFACLGPALEIFSRYASVEKANGEQITLREYLEYVWAAVSKEALSTIFSNADATGFEEDARLSAMWLWTLSTGEEAEEDGKTVQSTGYALEYDAARKIAQGLGVHLENLTNLVEIKGSNARLLPVTERSLYLFGKETTTTPKKKKKKGDTPLLPGLEDFKDTETSSDSDIPLPSPGKTILDQIHQTMILFATGRSEALKRLLVDEGVGQNQRFWTLAQALSALYPPNAEEKRWVDGVLARKKGLGF